MNLKNLGLGIALTVVCASAIAAEPWAPTDMEMASLPAFCKARFNEGSPEYKRWASTLGPDFGHTHHYCMGINFINRYYRARSNQDKRFNLNNAQGELQYMVTHAAPTYSLMPDVYLSLGVVYSLMNQPAQAITHYNKAIELNPRQPRAYGALSDYYVKSKQNTKALEIVTKGLRHNPETKSLQRRYTELGGTLPYPEPIVLSPAAEPSTPPAAQTESVPSPPESAPATTPAPVEPIAEPQIGSPTNPYCRFCPD